MVPADSNGVSPAPPYSGIAHLLNVLLIRDYHRLWFWLPTNSNLEIIRYRQPYNPKPTQIDLVWAFPISLATTLGITIVFFSSGYLDVSVPQVATLYKAPHTRRVSPFGNLRITSYIANPRSLSQHITSFIDTKSQGILHTPL